MDRCSCLLADTPSGRSVRPLAASLLASAVCRDCCPCTAQDSG